VIVLIAVARWVEYAGLLGFLGLIVVRVLAGQPPALRWARPRMEMLAMSAITWRRGVPLARAEAVVALAVVAATAVLAVLPLPVAVSTIP
jgi:hypothetical protein